METQLRPSVLFLAGFKTPPEGVERLIFPFFNSGLNGP